MISAANVSRGVATVYDLRSLEELRAEVRDLVIRLERRAALADVQARASAKYQYARKKILHTEHELLKKLASELRAILALSEMREGTQTK